MNKVLRVEVEENHKLFCERREFYLSHGFDIEREVARILQEARPFGGPILEIGTGKGHFALALAQSGYDFTSVDVSEEAQQIARLNFEYYDKRDSVELCIQNAEALEFADGQFNAIFSVNALHHFTRPFQVLDECVRVLSLTGKLVLSDFNENGLRVIAKIHAVEGREHDVHHAGIAGVEECLAGKGFTVRKAATFTQDIIIAERIGA